MKLGEAIRKKLVEVEGEIESKHNHASLYTHKILRLKEKNTVKIQN